MAMDISVRPGAQSAPVTAVRPVADAVQQAVPTQLPESQTVTAIQRPADSRNDPEFNRERLARQIVYDRKAAQYVYQVLDGANEDVVVQYPDEARVRARAYFRELEQSRMDQNRQERTDRTA